MTSNYVALLGLLPAWRKDVGQNEKNLSRRHQRPCRQRVRAKSIGTFSSLSSF